MKCSKCEIENPKENKFCSNCGSEFLDTNSSSVYCNNCGASNNKTNKFCEECGFAIRKSFVKKDNGRRITEKNQRQNRPRKRHVEKKLDFIDLIEKHKAATVVILFIVGYGLLQLFSPDESVVGRQNYTTPNSNISYGLQATQINEIASKFICSCGTCGELPLEECDCPTAREEKNFIKSKLDQKMAPGNIISAVNNKYGWIKPQFAGLVSGATELINPVAAAKPVNQADGNLATLADMDQIVKQFRCPCGQCGIDELFDCGCSHPKGAQEVKGFIANKISENIYSAEQIVSIVDRTYGGKK